MHYNLITLTFEAESDAGAVQSLFDGGYSATDIITTLFRVVRNADLHEFVKLEFIRVRLLSQSTSQRNVSIPDFPSRGYNFLRIHHYMIYD